MKKILYLLILPLILFLVSCGGGEGDLQPVDPIDPPTLSLEETLVGKKWSLSNEDEDGFILSPGGGFFTTKRCTPHDWEGDWFFEGNLIKYSYTQNSIQTTVLWGEVTEYSATEVKILEESSSTLTTEKVYLLNTQEDIFGCTDIDGSNYDATATCDDGSCLIARTYVPDNKFEQELINLFYDDILDDSVVTSYIDTITSLNLGWYSNGMVGNTILDLTGLEDFLALKNLIIKSQSTLYNLDLSNLSYLEFLDAEGCGNVTELNLSNNPNLTQIKIKGMNKLTSLDLRNGNNTNLSSFSLTGLDDLDCISVDDPTWSYTNWVNHWRIQYQISCP